MKKILTLIAAVFLTCAVSQIQAAPITGSISFFGSTSVSGSSGPGTTTVDFDTNWDFITGTGIYSSILFLTPTTMNDFSFTGDGIAATLTAPDLPMWSLTSGGNNYSFDLLALTSGHTEQGSMAFTGTGMLHATGFDDTAATVGITGTGTNYNFTLSFTTNSAVPEPSSTILVGVGLALGAVAVYRRRRRGAIA